MPIVRMDHFTILTTDANTTATFYRDLLGLVPGPRPVFPFPGVWLYDHERAVLHVIERVTIPNGAGVLDHIAFWGQNLPSFLAKLKVRGLNYELDRLPDGGHAAGVWQLIFYDPNGARIEIDFAATESAGTGE